MTLVITLSYQDTDVLSCRWIAEMSTDATAYVESAGEIPTVTVVEAPPEDHPEKIRLRRQHTKEVRHLASMGRVVVIRPAQERAPNYNFDEESLEELTYRKGNGSVMEWICECSITLVSVIAYQWHITASLERNRAAPAEELKDEGKKSKKGKTGNKGTKGGAKSKKGSQAQKGAEGTQSTEGTEGTDDTDDKKDTPSMYTSVS